MDNAQKAIMIGVGLFITIIIISAVLLITNLGTDLIDSAAGQVTEITGSLKTDLMSKYDGKTLSGSNILSFISQYSDSDAMGIVIKTDSVNLFYGVKRISGVTNKTEVDFKVGGIRNANFSTSTNANTLNTYADAVSAIGANDMFKTALVYNAAGNLIGVAAIEI